MHLPKGAAYHTHTVKSDTCFYAKNVLSKVAVLL